MKEPIENNLLNNIASWRDEEHYDVTYHNETTIDIPIKDMWPFFIKLKEWWNDDFDVEVISGKEGKVGYTVKTWFSGSVSDKKNPYHYYKIIEVIENKLVTIKVFSENGGSYGSPEYMSFETFLLNECEGKTKVSFIYNSEFTKKGRTPEKIRNNPQEMSDYLDSRHIKIWRDLKEFLIKSGSEEAVTE